jgi:group I intron endonuclease
LIDYKNKGGIYKIRNIINNKVYIGSATNLYQRKREHFSRLNNNKHENQYLQNSWNKYGKNNFLFEVIEYVENDNKLIEREQYYFNITNCCKRENGYNIRPKAESNLGTKRTDEQRKKLSEVHKGLQIGENNGVSKLKEKQVMEIRNILQTKQYEIIDIAKLYSVNINTIYNIKYYKTWKHIVPELNGKLLDDRSGENSPLHKLTNKDVINIKLLLIENKLKPKEIANIFNINTNTLHSIKSGKTWNNIIVDGHDNKFIDNSVKLTREQVIQIKELLKNKVPQRKIAEMFNVTHSTVGAIKRRKIWKDIPTEENIIYNAKIKLTVNDVIEIKKLLKTTNLSLKEIASKYNVNDETIRTIKTGETWKNVKLEDYFDENSNLKEII